MLSAPYLLLTPVELFEQSDDEPRTRTVATYKLTAAHAPSTVVDR
jgi:hypothetical protein